METQIITLLKEHVYIFSKHFIPDKFVLNALKENLCLHEIVEII